MIEYAHIASRHMLHTKRLVSITLDVECYDDFHPEDLDWNEILDLEGDEHVDVSIKITQRSSECATKKKCPP